MNEMEQLISAALTARQHGISTVPVELPGKRPPERLSWKWRQDRIPDELTIKRDLSEGNGNRGLAIIAGKVSGNLEVLDFDLEGAAYPEWVSLVETEAPGLIGRLCIQQTRSGGYHVNLRCREVTIPKSQELAHKGIEVSGPGQREHKGKKYIARQHGGQWYIYPTLIETRGEGGYAVAAPSPGYAVVQTPKGREFFDPPIITAVERDILHRCARALEEKPPEKIEEGPKQTASTSCGLRPGEDFNQRGNVLETLLRSGWKQAGGNAERQQLTRPGKEKGISATLYDSRTLHVFSSNADPFEQNKSYSAFAVCALLLHGGDFEKTARELARQGYGMQALEKLQGREGAEQAIDVYDPQRNATSASYHLTDTGNGQRFADQHRDNIRYSYPSTIWLVWDGTRWKQDKEGLVRQLAKQTARSIYREAEQEPDSVKSQKIGKWAIGSGGSGRLDSKFWFLSEALPG
jgi:hypothetical protein